MKNYFILFIFIAGLCTGCKPDQREKEIALNEKELTLKEKEIDLKTAEAQKNTTPASEKAAAASSKFATINEAVLLAEKKFAQYLPTILKSHDAVLDLQKSYTGDFTGDGVEDVAIFFSLSVSGGGNAGAGEGITLYQNTGNDVKVIAGFEPDYLFSFTQISNGRIYIDKLAYAEGDGNCCPSIKKKHALTIEGSKVF